MGQKILMCVSSIRIYKTLFIQTLRKHFDRPPLLAAPDTPSSGAKQQPKDTKFFVHGMLPPTKRPHQMGTLRLQKHHMVIITIPKSLPDVNVF